MILMTLAWSSSSEKLTKKSCSYKTEQLIQDKSRMMERGRMPNGGHLLLVSMGQVESQIMQGNGLNGL